MSSPVSEIIGGEGPPPISEDDLDVFFRLAVERGASDLFLQTGHTPMARLNGAVQALHDQPMSKEKRVRSDALKKRRASVRPESGRAWPRALNSRARRTRSSSSAFSK